jgi:N-acetylglutamate synthase-like GNAT family acetyltransferase
MHLRSATAEDGPHITALLQRCYPVLMASAYEPVALAAALPLMTRANPALLASGTYYVVETQGKIVGAGGWTRDKPGGGGFDGETGHIRHFATDPDHLRQGIGHTLIERCLADAREAGLSQMECFASLNAVAFYAASGFEPLGPVDIWIGGTVPLPSLHMRRRL